MDEDDAVLEKIKAGQDAEAVILLEKMIENWHVFLISTLSEIMHYAVIKNCEQVIRTMHRKWPTVVDIVGSDGETPLKTAARNGNDSMIYLLAELGTCAHLWIGEGEFSPMECAVYKGYTSTVLALHQIGSTEASHRRNEGVELLDTAVKCGHLEVIKVLHQINPELIRVNAPEHMPVLHNCAFMSRNLPEVMELLCTLDRSIIDAVYGEDATPMHKVMCVNYPRNIQRFVILHRYGSEAHFSVTDDGRTPGTYADYENNSSDIVDGIIRRVYFSRALSEVLFFTLDDDALQPSRRI